MPDLYRRLEDALLETDPERKCRQTAKLYRAWQSGRFTLDPKGKILTLEDPGRPELPRLVNPRRLERRSVASPAGRIRLLHAFAHIEFNAINIALDAVYRFRELPRRYIADWLRVAAEEAAHFTLLADELDRRGSGYGEHPAHAGLWDMACRTRHDALHRMALVPRVMEARGLDVTPAMISKFQQVGDAAAVAILQVIYHDEVGHVRIGDHWFRHLCARRCLDPEATFRRLVKQYMDGKLRGPFNWDARLAAGFKTHELEALERGL